MIVPQSGGLKYSSGGNTIIVNCQLSIIILLLVRRNTNLHYDTLICFRIAEIAPFSNRDTWAWEMPIAWATSIWVRPS